MAHHYKDTPVPLMLSLSRNCLPGTQATAPAPAAQLLLDNQTMSCRLSLYTAVAAYASFSASASLARLARTPAMRTFMRSTRSLA